MTPGDPLWIVPRRPLRALRLPQARYSLPSWWTLHEARAMVEVIARLLDPEPLAWVVLPARATHRARVLGHDILALVEPDDTPPHTALDARLVFVRGGPDDDRGWLERLVKPAFLSALRAWHQDPEHPLRQYYIASLDLDDVARCTADPLDSLHVVAAAIEHRLAHTTEDTHPGAWSSSLQHARDVRLIDRIQRLPAPARSTAVDLVYGVPSTEGLAETLPLLRAHWLADGTAARPRLGALLRGAAHAGLGLSIDSALGQAAWSPRSREARSALEATLSLSPVAGLSAVSPWVDLDDDAWFVQVLDEGCRALANDPSVEASRRSEAAQGLGEVLASMRTLATTGDLPLPVRRAQIEGLRAAVVAWTDHPLAAVRNLAQSISAALTLMLRETGYDLAAHGAALDTLRQIAQQAPSLWARKVLVLGLLSAAQAVMGSEVDELQSLLQEVPLLPDAFRDRVSFGLELMASKFTDGRTTPLEAEQRLRREVLPRAERLGPWHRARAEAMLAEALGAQGQTDAALSHLHDEVLPVYERLGDLRRQAATLLRVGAMLAERGDLDEALSLLHTRVMPLIDRLDDDRGRVACLSTEAEIVRQQGDPTWALRRLEDDVLPLYERLADRIGTLNTRLRIVELRSARGDHDGALRLLREQVFPMLSQARFPLIAAHANASLGVVLLRSGDVTRGIAALELARTQFDAAGEVSSRIHVRLGLLEGYSAQGDFAAAQRVGDEAQALAEASSPPLFFDLVARQRARLSPGPGHIAAPTGTSAKPPKRRRGRP